jgi:hypothetical protein
MMPVALHAPLTNTPGLMLKERTEEPLVPNFTAVNRKTSPTSPRKPYPVNNMSNPDSNHTRPTSRNSPEQPQRHQGALTRVEWGPVRNVPDNDRQSGRSSPSPSEEDQSPTDSGKRKRSSSAEDRPPDQSLDGALATRPRLDSYAAAGRDSPNTVAQVQQLAIEYPQQVAVEYPQPNTLPPMERSDPERAWAQSHDRNGYHEVQRRDPRPREPSHDNMRPHSASYAQLNGVDDSDELEQHSSTTEITRAGVHVDPKKRKRVSSAP